jgi:hypothetical protein
VPYFEEVERQTQGEIDQVVFDGYQALIHVEMNEGESKGSVIEGAELLPDGFIKVSEAN